MKVSSNKAKSSEKTVKSGKAPSAPSYSENKRQSIEKISNGFIIETSWTDKEGRYQCKKAYSETNPLDSVEEEEED